MKRYRPTEQAPKTGFFTLYDRDGQNLGTNFFEKGQRFPKAEKLGDFYVISENPNNTEAKS